MPPAAIRTPLEFIKQSGMLEKAESKNLAMPPFNLRFKIRIPATERSRSSSFCLTLKFGSIQQISTAMTPQDFLYKIISIGIISNKFLNF